MDLKRLISGTDIRGIVEKYENRDVTLTGKEVKYIAKGFGKWIDQKFGRNAVLENRNIRIAVGYDARNTSEEFSKLIINTLKDMGIDVYNCKMTITPSLFMSTIFEDYKADGGVMITASHLPSYYNGLKFFSPNGGLEKEDIVEFLDMMGNNNCDCIEKMEKALELEKEKGKLKTKNLSDDYSEYLCDLIRKGSDNGEYPLEGMRIVIDAGNGAAGFIAEKVIKKLGGDTTGSQFLDPDGNFPNHVPNPEVKEAMESIKKAVLDNNADFGIIFDADGDRSSFIDNKGREINRTNLIALLSDIVLKETPGATIVTDSLTSTGLKKFIEDRGGKHHRFVRGYRNIINEAKRLTENGQYAPLAIETSGHAAFLENYFLDDGAYMAAKLLIELVKSNKKGILFTDVLNELDEPGYELELRFKILGKDFKNIGNEVIKDLEKHVMNVESWVLEKPNYEGVRVNINKENWFLLRLSLHEPLLCLNMECINENKAKEILHVLKEFFQNYETIDDSIIK